MNIFLFLERLFPRFPTRQAFAYLTEHTLRSRPSGAGLLHNRNLSVGKFFSLSLFILWREKKNCPRDGCRWLLFCSWRCFAEAEGATHLIPGCFSIKGKLPLLEENTSASGIDPWDPKQLLHSGNTLSQHCAQSQFVVRLGCTPASVTLQALDGFFFTQCSPKQSRILSSTM